MPTVAARAFVGAERAERREKTPAGIGRIAVPPVWSTGRLHTFASHFGKIRQRQAVRLLNSRACRNGHAAVAGNP